MKTQNIKQYSDIYFVTFGYNGAQFNESEVQIDKSVSRTSKSMAHDKFIENINKRRNIPTPKFEDCKFDIVRVSYTETSGKYRVYTVGVEVTWQYIKD